MPTTPGNRRREGAAKAPLTDANADAYWHEQARDLPRLMRAHLRNLERRRRPWYRRLWNPAAGVSPR